MGIIYNSLTPSEGLVLSLDTANRRSYPGSGNTWFDLSGNGNNGTLTNGASLNTGPGGGMNFDGIDDRIPCGVAPILSNRFAISLWFRPNSLTTSNTYLLSGLNSSLNDNNYSIVWEYLNNNVEFYAGPSLPQAAFRTNSQIIINSIGWYHICYNYQGTQLTAWNNGILFNTNNISASLNINNGNLIIGSFNTGYNFAGLIDDIRIYNRALSESEIRILFNSRRRRYGL